MSEITTEKVPVAERPILFSSRWLGIIRPCHQPIQQNSRQLKKNIDLHTQLKLAPERKPRIMQIRPKCVLNKQITGGITLMSSIPLTSVGVRASGLRLGLNLFGNMAVNARAAESVSRYLWTSTTSITMGESGEKSTRRSKEKCCTSNEKGGLRRTISCSAVIATKARKGMEGYAHIN